MKAISLLQPWASLWAANPTLKLHETRSWSTNYRGAIAIHASKRKDKRGRELWGILWNSDRMRNSGLPRSFDELPFGAIIATTTIEEVFCTSDLLKQIKLDPLDCALGDFGINRFAWRRGPITGTYITPIPIKGDLGLWNWEPLLP